MKVEQWVPPAAESPSPWQVSQAEKYLQAKADALALELARLTGGHAVLGPMSCSLGVCDGAGCEAELAEGLRADSGLLAGLVAAALGYDTLVELDLDGPAEQAVAAALGRRVCDWIAQVMGPMPPQGADLVVEIRGACLGTRGHIRILACWAHLWRGVYEWLAASAPRLRLPLRAIGLRATGLLRGPTLRVADALGMKVGDVVALPAGAERSVVLAVHGVPVAMGTLGALSDHLAVRVERVAGGIGRDGE